MNIAPFVGDVYIDDISGAVDEYSRKIRAGQIRTIDDVQNLVWVSDQLRHYGDEYTGCFVGPGGRPLQPDDAGLVWRMGEAETWVADKNKKNGYHRVIELFNGRETELDVPMAYLPVVDAARVWMGRTLRLDNPNRFLLQELADMAADQLRLSDEIKESGMLDGPSPHDGVWTVEMPAGPDAVEVRIWPSDGKKVNGAIPGTDLVLPIQRRDSGLLVPASELVENDRWRRWSSEYQVIPRDPNAGEVRSHRRPNNHRFLKAVAMTALSGLLLFVPSSVAKTKPADTPKEPVRVQVVPNVLAPGLEQPPTEPNTSVESTDPPAQTPEPETDHIITLGSEYNPDAHTGAVWFAVEDYAADLGHPKLTILQVHLLTQKTLDYMSTRLPGGMNWTKALKISPNDKLPFPPAQTMNTWIDQVTAQVGKPA